MDEQRALLDQLMGLNRDGDKPQEEVKDFRDSRVCKRYLAGLCVHDLFQNTKMDLGECSKLHLPELRQQYEVERKKRDFGYEYELEKELYRYHSDVQRKVQSAERRIKETDGSSVPEEVTNNTQVLELTAEIQELLEQAEAKGMEGEVEASMKLIEQVEGLKQKKAAVQAEAMLSVAPNPTCMEDLKDISANKPTMKPVNQKLRVCDVCGAYLSIFDSDRRLADHFGGKLHLGYLQIKKKIDEIHALLGTPTHREDRRRSPPRSNYNRRDHRHQRYSRNRRHRSRSSSPYRRR